MGRPAGARAPRAWSAAYAQRAWPLRQPATGHRLPGLKSFAEAREPGILDWSVVDDVVRVDDEPAYSATKRLHREEALIVGPSTGAIVHAAADYEGDGIAVGVSPDSGVKYTSYFKDFLGTEGLPQT